MENIGGAEVKWDNIGEIGTDENRWMRVGGRAAF